MQIYGPSHVHSAQPLNAPHTQRAQPAGGASSAQSASDQLDISEAADIASRLSEIPDVRQDRVAEIRSALADGSYDIDSRLDVALDRLLDEIG